MTICDAPHCFLDLRSGEKAVDDGTTYAPALWRDAALRIVREHARGLDDDARRRTRRRATVRGGRRMLTSLSSSSSPSSLAAAPPPAAPSSSSSSSKGDRLLSSNNDDDDDDDDDDTKPLFLYYADSLVHEPVQAPEEAFVRYAAALEGIPNKERKVFGAMTCFLDEVVANLTAALQERGLWNSTIFVYASDNGACT